MPNIRNFILIVLITALFSIAPGELKAGTAVAATPDNTQPYGLTPDDYRPYGHFTKPYKEYFLVPNEYHGYGREIPEPAVDSVKIGFIGPIEKTVSVATGGASHEEGLGRMMLHGAELAIEHANAQNGYRGQGIPYELKVRNDNGLWGAIASEVIHLAYIDKVWAILGSIDGANSHIAIRAALKIEIPVMTSGDTDPTFVETALPWAFRCITDDRQMCYLLADFVFKKLGLTRVAAFRANNRYGRFGIDEFRDAATRLGHPFLAEINYQIGDTDFSSQIQYLKGLDPQAIITFGDARESALILKQMREMGLDVWFLGSDRMATPEFVEIVDGNLDKVAAGYPYNPDSTDPKSVAFRKSFKERFGEPPETYAAHAYDGISMFIHAIEKAGLNRALIRDELAAMKSYHGVTGIKTFDPIANNISQPYLALGRDGRFVFLSKKEALQ